MGQGRLSPSSSFWLACFPWRPFSSLAFFSSLLSAECGVGGASMFFPLQGPPSSFRPSSSPWGPPFLLQTVLFPLGDPFILQTIFFHLWGPPFLLQTIFFPLGASRPPSHCLLSPGGTLSILRRVFRLLGRGLHTAVRTHRVAPLETTTPPLLGWRRHRSQDP